MPPVRRRLPDLRPPSPREYLGGWDALHPLRRLRGGSGRPGLQIDEEPRSEDIRDGGSGWRAIARLSQASRASWRVWGDGERLGERGWGGVSRMEEQMALQLRAAGLLDPQREYRAIAGRRWRIDCAWPIAGMTPIGNHTGALDALEGF